MWQRILFLVTLTGLSIAAYDPAARSQEKPVYEVYAISYGVIPDFPVSSLVAGADPSRKLDIQMMVWLLKGTDGRYILVDSGFYRDKFFKQWKVKDFIKPSDAVAKFGVKPEEITDIIITHMHWDHADGFDLFPKARVWIQKDEYVYYTGEAWQSRNTHGGVDPEDVMAMVRLKTVQRQARKDAYDGVFRAPADRLEPVTEGQKTAREEYEREYWRHWELLRSSPDWYELI